MEEMISEIRDPKRHQALIQFKACPTPKVFSLSAGQYDAEDSGGPSVEASVFLSHTERQTSTIYLGCYIRSAELLSSQSGNQGTHQSELRSIWIPRGPDFYQLCPKITRLQLTSLAP